VVTELVGAGLGVACCVTPVVVDVAVVSTSAETAAGASTARTTSGRAKSARTDRGECEAFS